MTRRLEAIFPVGTRVTIPYAGTEPATAVIDAYDPERPNVVKVIYEHSRTSAWVAKRRIGGKVRDDA